MKGLIEDVLAQLSRDDELVLRCTYLEPLPTEDLARLLRCTEGSVRVELHRARDTFRREAKRLGYEVDLGGGS